jgi:acyl-CoA thioesterase FadM
LQQEAPHEGGIVFSIEQHVYNSQVDRTGRQTNESIVMMMQDCSLASLKAQPDLRDYLKAHNIVMMVGSRQVDIFRHARYPEKIEVRTNVYKVRGAVSIRNTGLFDENERAVAMCWGVAAFVHLDTGKLAMIPKEVTRLYPPKQRYPMDYLDRKIALPEGTPQSFDPVPVRRADLDQFGHLNNARAIRIADEYTPEDRVCTRIRAAYHRQAKPGAVLHPVVWNTPLAAAAGTDAEPGTASPAVLADEGAFAASDDSRMPVATSESGAEASRLITDHASLKTTVALESADGEPYVIVEFTY